MADEKARELLKVIAGNYCIGCGACAAMQPESIELQRPQNGLYRPEPRPGAALDMAERVCPFTSAGEDEDTLGRELFGDAPHHSAYLGHYREIWAGHVVEEPYRAAGSSGGMGTWLLAEALRQGVVDRVIHVRAREGSPGEPLFGYEISEHLAQVQAGSKSRYYPIEISQVVRQVHETPGKYAFVGIPCFLKALRNICANDPVMNERVIFFVGLFCGHMKTADFAASLAWQLGIAPDDLAAVDFRRKLANRGANDYGFSASDGAGRQVEAPMADLFGREWGLGFFKPQACEFCDDVVGELADISVGDAWLPQYVGDPKGTNVLIVRTAAAAGLVAAAHGDKRLDIEPLSAEDAYKSQEGGFHHRRGGLAYRLWLKDHAKQWRPRKRVSPQRSHLSFIRRRIYKLRSYLSQYSHLAFARAREQKSFAVFPELMRKPVEKYRRLLLVEYYLKRIRRWRA